MGTICIPQKNSTHLDLGQVLLEDVNGDFLLSKRPLLAGTSAFCSGGGGSLSSSTRAPSLATSANCRACWFKIFAASCQAQRVQVPNNHMHAQNHDYNYYYPNPKYLIIGYMDPLGSLLEDWRSWGQALSLHARRAGPTCFTSHSCMFSSSESTPGLPGRCGPRGSMYPIIRYLGFGQ